MRLCFIVHSLATDRSSLLLPAKTGAWNTLIISENWNKSVWHSQSLHSWVPWNSTQSSQTLNLCDGDRNTSSAADAGSGIIVHDNMWGTFYLELIWIWLNYSRSIRGPCVSDYASFFLNHTQLSTLIKTNSHMSDQAFWTIGGTIKASYLAKCPLKLIWCLGWAPPPPSSTHTDIYIATEVTHTG